MIMNKEEVEKAAENYTSTGQTYCREKTFVENAFIAGVEFSEEYVQQYVQDLIVENQGLKLYKDNEAERFKELAVEFARYIRNNPKEVKDWEYTIFEEGKVISDNTKKFDNIEEIYDKFKKEKDE